MKTLFMAGLFGSTLLATGALAQSAPPVANQAAPVSKVPEFITQLSPGSMLLSDLMDQDVVGPDNKNIGAVEDLVLDRTGQVAAVVIEVDKGLGDRTVALPMSAFRITTTAAATGSIQDPNQNSGSPQTDRADEMRLMLTMPADQLKSIPEFGEDD